MLTRVYDAASALQSFCEKENWRFCFIGGIAVQRWGEPRQTVDADLTFLTGFGAEEKFVDGSDCIRATAFGCTAICAGATCPPPPKRERCGPGCGLRRTSIRGANHRALLLVEGYNSLPASNLFRGRLDRAQGVSQIVSGLGRHRANTH